MDRRTVYIHVMRNLRIRPVRHPEMRFMECKTVCILWMLLLAGTIWGQPPRPAQRWPAVSARPTATARFFGRPAADSARPASTARFFARPATDFAAIQAMVNAVSGDSMMRSIHDLENFGTRYEYTPQRDQAAAYLLMRLRALGYEPESDWYATGINTFADIAASGADTLWAVDTGGNVVRSDDGGATWRLLTRVDGSPLQGIALLSGTEAWVCGSGAVVRHTRDGGTTWRSVGLSGSATLYDVAALPSGAVLACGSGGTLLRKEASAEAWTPVSLGSTATLVRLHAVDADHVWCCGSSGALYFSNDGGRSWQAMMQNSASWFYALFFISAEEGWVAGADAFFARTSDHGKHWVKIDTNLPADLTVRDLIMNDAQHGRIVTNRGEIYTTSDGGWSWQEELSLLNLGWGPNLRRILQLPGGALAACGSQNVLLIKAEGQAWSSRTALLPESMIHTSRNIIALRRGVAAPDREVVLVAHYDSYSDDREHMAPGANDNGSGTSAVLEAARLCRACDFAVTLKFVLVSGEELGMFGSTHYVRQALAEKRGILAAVNGDMIGYPLTGDPARLVIGSYLTRSPLVDSALVYNARYGIAARLVTVVDSTGASDYGPFGAAGYEALDIAEGTAEDIWGGLDPYYHRTTDTSEKLSREMLQTGARLMLATAAEAAGAAGPTFIAGRPVPLPQQFALAQNFPNPFNAATRIEFTLPHPARVRLTIHNLRGQIVATLLARPLDAGRHAVRWDATGAPSGTYICRLAAEEWHAERKLLLLR